MATEPSVAASRIRIVLVDDHPIVLRGLQQLLDSHDDCHVVACCANAESGFFAVERRHPDVLVVDLRMPDGDGLALVRSLKEAGVRCQTVLLTAAIEESQVVEAVNLGVRGLVLKDSEPEALIECIRRVSVGDEWFDQLSVKSALVNVMTRESAAHSVARLLTPREIELVRLVAQGLRNRAIAERLSITEGTVKVHLHSVYEKLQLDGRLELTLYAQQSGLA